MVQIRWLVKGDTTKNRSLQQALVTVEKEMENGNVVFDEDERRIVNKATMGQITENSRLAVFPPATGG